MLFCCKICFVAIYALLSWKKIEPKLCLWRKKDKYEVCPPTFGFIQFSFHWISTAVRLFNLSSQKGPTKHFHKSLSHVCLLASLNLNIWKGLYPTLKSAVCQAWESCSAVVALKQHNQRCRAWIQPSRVALKQHNQSDPAWIRPLPESQFLLFWNKTTSRQSPWLTVLAVKSKINCIVILLTVFETQSDTNGIWKWW